MVRGWGNVGAEVKRLKHGLFVAVSNWIVRIFQKNSCDNTASNSTCILCCLTCELIQHAGVGLITRRKHPLLAAEAAGVFERTVPLLGLPAPRMTIRTFGNV